MIHTGAALGKMVDRAYASLRGWPCSFFAMRNGAALNGRYGAPGSGHRSALFVFTPLWRSIYPRRLLSFKSIPAFIIDWCEKAQDVLIKKTSWGVGALYAEWQNIISVWHDRGVG